MARYDQGWSRDYMRGGNEFDAGRDRGYGSDFGSWGDAWGSAPSAGFRGRGVGQYRGWGTRWESGGYGGDYSGGGAYGGGAFGGYDRGFGGQSGQGGYRAGGYGGGGYGGGADRGLYGEPFPGYGGYPGGREQGMYYGGRSGYDRGYGIQRTYQAGRFGGGQRQMGGRQEMGGGYDRGYANEPFMPEEAYRQHPEYNRPQHQTRGRWPDVGHEFGPGGMELDDGEIRQAVRQNLYNDSWVDAERVQVEVNEGVVTLSGEVNDYMEARYAWDDAWESAGVRGVINQLAVRLDQPSDPHGEVLPQTEGGKKGSGKAAG